nr:uncharacterized protein C11orf98-like [Lytechinus pictus]
MNSYFTLQKPPFKHIKTKGKVKRLRNQSKPPMRRKLDARRDEQESAASGKIVTKHMNKVLRRNPRANVNLSSKKKRKLMKGRMHAEREANVMTVEVETTPSEKPTKQAKSKKSSPGDDVEMMET